MVNLIKNNFFDCSSRKQFRDFMYASDCIDIIMKCIKNENINGNIIYIGSAKIFRVKLS